MDKKENIIISEDILFNYNFEKLIFDSSSLIYIYKADLLNSVINNFKIFITNFIINEINSGKDNLYESILNNYKLIKIEENEIIDFLKENSFDKKQKLTFTDISIILSADKLNLPVVTEDKNIIAYFYKKNIPFLNSLSLVFILLREKLIEKNFALNKIFEISKYGFYSDEVFSAIFNLIINFKN